MGLTCVVLLGSTGCSDPGSAVSDCGDGVCEQPQEGPLSCPEDCYGICGNGVADPDEQCDGEDFGGSSCLDHGCGYGELACTDTCEVIVSGCGSPCGSTCGDGVRENDEACDCGVDDDALPTLCAAPNGHVLSVCNADCTWSLTCGNQVVDSGEMCDCGIDPDNLPAGCTHPNGYPEGNCTASCTDYEGACYLTLEDDIMCDPNQGHYQCCPDNWGNPAQCSQAGIDTFWCFLQCQTTTDCHYNHSCDAEDQVCAPASCGPAVTGESYYGTCQVPGGRDGICLPVGLAAEDIGICLENSPNALPPRDGCTQAHLLVSFPRDQGIDRCFDGICLNWNPNAAAECLSICDWQDVYDNETNLSWCGFNTNCVAESYITPNHPDPTLRGMRDADISYCRPTRDEDNLFGVTGCDLLNDELIANRNQLCDDWRAGTHCRIAVITDAGASSYSYGTLIGNCVEPTGGTPVGVWQVCDPTTDECAPNTACFPEDAFSSTPSSGPHRCVPLCDTADPNPCAPTHPTVPSSNVCTSLSVRFRPGATPGTSEDSAPTRVGLCALVPQ